MFSCHRAVVKKHIWLMCGYRQHYIVNVIPQWYIVVCYFATVFNLLHCSALHHYSAPRHCTAPFHCTNNMHPCILSSNVTLKVGVRSSAKRPWPITKKTQQLFTFRNADYFSSDNIAICRYYYIRTTYNKWTKVKWINDSIRCLKAILKD